MKHDAPPPSTTIATPEPEAAYADCSAEAVLERARVSERARNRQMVGVEDETVDPTSITIPDRLRPLDEGKVAEIMESMRKVGQINPVLVRWTGEGADERILTLVSGRHRLEAAIRLGWTEINVRLFQCDQIEARKLEIAENLHRSELSPEERDLHVLEWDKVVAGVEKEVEDSGARAPLKPGHGRGSKGGDRQIARETGVGKDTVRRAKKLDKLPPEIKQAANRAGLSRAAKLRIADAPDIPVALQDEVEKKRAPKAAPTTPKPPPAPEPEAVEPKDDAPSLFDDDPAAAARRRRELIEQIASGTEEAAPKTEKLCEYTPEEYLSTYLMRAGAAVEMAVYPGDAPTPTPEMIEMAELVLKSWQKLLANLKERTDSVAPPPKPKRGAGSFRIKNTIAVPAKVAGETEGMKSRRFFLHFSREDIDVCNKIMCDLRLESVAKENIKELVSAAKTVSAAWVKVAERVELEAQAKAA